MRRIAAAVVTGGLALLAPRREQAQSQLCAYDGPDWGGPCRTASCPPRLAQRTGTARR